MELEERIAEIRHVGLSRHVKTLGYNSLRDFCEATGTRQQTIHGWLVGDDDRKHRTLLSLIDGSNSMLEVIYL